MEEKDILKMYDLVFQDMVKCYVENYNDDEENEEDFIDLEEDKIKEIAYKMIYKNEYLWEIINDTIGTYLEKYLEEENEDEDYE